jgi:aminopeptidase-like protein
MIGIKMHKLAERLFPINRSITGDGIRKTLSILSEQVENLDIFEVPSGTKVFDWIVPKEWSILTGYIITPDGRKICDIKTNNLHVVGYSLPVEGLFSLEELQQHLHSLPDQPNAIPYVTSYYEENWGFCISHKERSSLKEGIYQVKIDSSQFDGSLTYGELIIKGESDQEIFISTYVCHPSMANNELSGPVVATYLAKWIKSLHFKRYSYRIIFIPETIGSITYLSRNFRQMKTNIIAGFNVSCVGDNRSYSYLPSRNGETLSDKIARHILGWIDSDYFSYSWLDRGSDERQYCAPGVDLPIASIMRTKYGIYPEYHTSLDDLKNVVTPEGLEGGYEAIRLSIEAIENNFYPKVTVLGEPQFGRRGLFPSISHKNSISEDVTLMLHLTTWSDGNHSLLEIAEKCNVPIWKFYPLIKKLHKHKLLELHEDRANQESNDSF